MTLYAIGDIQGCSVAFEKLLRAISFEPRRDHLWLVGDLVNRGPDSLGVLRRVIALGESATCVLGNHDLHLVATAAGARAIGSEDTFEAALNAPDAAELIEWLRCRPLLHFEPRSRRLLVHAGLPPLWTVEQALRHAREVTDLLRAGGWRSALTSLYSGRDVRAWSETLPAEERHRYTLHALTRMRYCDAAGLLDFECSGPPGTQPSHLMPWFDLPGRLGGDVHVVFGHWAALGIVRRADITALDSGCVWGGSLTAVPLAPAGAPVSVACRSAG